MKTDNELIAEFMGGMIHDLPDGFGNINRRIYFAPGNNPNPHCGAGTYKRVEDLDYDKRWEWLMPAMTQAKQAISAAGWGVPTEKQALMKLRMALNEVSNINIKNAHFCLVHFIKWYNEQKNL